MKFTLKNNSENKRSGQAVRSKFSAILKEKNNLKKILQDDMEILEGKRDKVQGQMRLVKDKTRSLQQPENFGDCSTEELRRRLEKTEMKLTTAELNKQE